MQITSLTSETLSLPTDLWVDGERGSGTLSTLVLFSCPELDVTNQIAFCHHCRLRIMCSIWRSKNVPRSPSTQMSVGELRVCLARLANNHCEQSFTMLLTIISRTHNSKLSKSARSNISKNIKDI